MQRYKNTRTGKPPRFDGELVDNKGRKWPYVEYTTNNGHRGQRVYYCHPTKGWRSMAPTADMREVEHDKAE